MTTRWLYWFVASWIGLLTPAAAWAEVQATFYVAPDGNDQNPGTEVKPFATLDHARQAVRAAKGTQEMTGDIVVVLRGGVYRIDQTLAFEADDSGTGGHQVIYRAQTGETPLLSGGKPVTGWQKDEKGRWKAPAPCADFRQFYVDGKRATRARGKKPAGLELQGDNGYTTTDVGMAEWKNPEDLEFCYVNIWAHTRCKVQSITRKGDRAIITMLQPYFTQAKTKEGVQVSTASQIYDIYLENALELLDEPGEWYLDRKAQVVYYMPRPGEDMTKVAAIAPAVEKLVALQGTLDRPIHNLQFAGVTFEHGSWLQPSEIGFVDVQANFRLDWKNPMRRAGGLVAVHNEEIKSPANIVCRAAQSIRFERCTFTKLGASAIDLEYGSQDNTLVGCCFYDIGGSAIQVGDVLRDDHHPDDMRKIVKNNTITNCYIHDCGRDYMGAVGIFVGYTEGTVLTHNEIADLPYSAISVGWGWGEEDAGGVETYDMPYRYATPTPAKNNRIEYNHIHNVMKVLNDGGSIYTQGNMPGTVIQGNHVHDNRGYPGGIYLDEGSGFIEIANNLVYNVSTNPMSWNNANQNRKATCKEHDNFFGSNPAEAAPIIKKAGLEAEYQDLLKKP